jgi:hypothetical protein
VQGILQECGDIKTKNAMFNMTQEGPEKVVSYTAGATTTMQLHGFFHQVGASFPHHSLVCIA